MSTIIRKSCLLSLVFAPWVVSAADTLPAGTPTAIPWNDIGARVGADNQGGRLSVTPGESGACLHCAFQRLDGEATPEGLWLTSTVSGAIPDRLRVVATGIGRASDSMSLLAGEGEVSLNGQTASLSRPGLVEEYSAGVDGVRQDFIVSQAPPRPPAGDLVVNLQVSGARVETADYGARLLLENSGRALAYGRLQVTDATGRSLPAHMEARPISSIEQEFEAFSAADANLAIVVDDSAAIYPVRIDPTFSDANWVQMSGLSCPNSSVFAAVTDGASNLYIGGAFTKVGNLNASHIAKWNGTYWSALGSGMETNVLTLAVSGGTLYAGGIFTTAGGGTVNYIAQWNGTNWSALGSGMNSAVGGLAISGGTLYACGGFSTAGGQPANSIAQWDGTNWSALGSGVNSLTSTVNTLAVSGGILYLGGWFTMVGGVPATNIAQWNGSAWSPLGAGLNTGSQGMGVNALVVSGGTLYAGGDFTTAGGSPASHVAQWDGTSWSPLGPGITGRYVANLALLGGNLCASGDFTNAGGGAANNIARWNGSTWLALDSGVNGPVRALAVAGATLYAGGGYFPDQGFTTAGGIAATNIAQWNGTNWSALNTEINGTVRALAVFGTNLYIGGDFTSPLGNAPIYIIQWDGTTWSPLGLGVDGSVSALAVSGGTLYAGGIFTHAGGSPANNIAQWNGSSWSALGSGLTGGIPPGGVLALAVSGGTLYAGGNFDTAGGSPAAQIAQWNGSSWSSVGSGITGSSTPGLNSLAVSGGKLYAGGRFYSMGFTAAEFIAQWDGTNWSPVGVGVDGPVYAITFSDSALYAGGIFTSAGGLPTGNIAKWDGNNWSKLGAGMGTIGSSAVYSLALSSGTLYAAGTFTSAGGTTASNIAQWDGTDWSTMGSGLGNRGHQADSVLALAVVGGTLYAGGNFQSAGTNTSQNLAEGIVGQLTINYTNSTFGFTNGIFGFDLSGPSGSDVVIQTSADLQIWVPVQTNSLGIGICHFTDPQSATNVPPRYYRAELLLQ